MVLMDKFKSLSRLKQIIICSTAVVVVVAIVLGIVLNRNKYTATTMRLLNVEGTVNIEDSNGSSRPVKGNMRFQSGDAMSTGSDGIASVGLDETKIITLQNDSRAEFTKSGKHLELKLTKGAVFFNVTEKLKPDETFEIKTSTMTAGIRGTSGMVYYDIEDDGKETIVVTDGLVALTATNQTTGETKTTEVAGGEEAQVTYYDDRKTDSVEFSNSKVKAEDLDDFALRNIGKDKKLVKRVATDTGWDQGGLEDAIKDAEERQKAPTPTATPSPTPMPTVTPSATPTPVPKPTSPSATPTPPPTPTPTPTITLTPTPEPTFTPTPKPTKKPTSTPKPTNTPTSTPTNTPTSTPTNTPTVTPSPSPTNTPTNTPTSTPTNTPTVTPIPGPSLPSGYSRTSLWNVNYGNNKVYICKLSDSGSADDYGSGKAEYRGYYEGAWFNLVHKTDHDLYYTAVNYAIIYEDGTLNGWSGEGTFTFSSDQYRDYVTNETYGGHSVHIIVLNSDGSYYGEWKGNWRALRRVSSSSNQYTYYINGSNYVYYVGK